MRKAMPVQFAASRGAMLRESVRNASSADYRFM